MPLSRERLHKLCYAACASIAITSVVAGAASAFWTFELDEAGCNYQAALHAGSLGFVNHSGDRWPLPARPIEHTIRAHEPGFNWCLPSWRMTRGFLHSSTLSGSARPGLTEWRQQWIVLPMWLPALLAAAGAVWLHVLGRRGAPGRCPRCGYDTAGLPGRTCPECGDMVAQVDPRSRSAAI